jgi:superfamily I DNA/RNA helicase
MTWLVPYADLTTDQMRAVDASADTHRLIVGAPGSGKTLALLHRTARLRERYNIANGRFRLLVFTNVLKQYIRAGAADLGIPLEAISTYDAWCADYFSTRIGGCCPWDAAKKRRDFAQIRERVHGDVLDKRPKLYDFVVVDEGQDLDPEAFEVLRTIASHVTVAADRKQQLYDHGASEEAIAGRLGLPRRNVSLLAAFRCSPYIVPLGAAFIADPAEAQTFRDQTLTAPGKRETPVLFVAQSFEEERQRLGEVARERAILGERVAILLPLSKQVFGFRKAMEEFGLEAEIQGPKQVLDFSSSAPKLLTYHSAKGLTFDTVLLPRLVKGSFERPAQDRTLRMMFVAVTRAARWVYLSTVAGQEPPFLARLAPLVEAGDLTQRRSDEGSQPAPPDEPDGPEGPDGLDDLFG